MVRFFQGVVSLNLYFFARASKYIRLMPSPRMLFHPEHWIAPSRMALSGSGMMRSGSTFSWLPSPVQAGQAPKGLLKENILGASSSMDTPQSSQA